MMNYTNKVKNEIMEHKQKAFCCKYSLSVSLLLFSKGSADAVFTTDSEALAKYYISAIRRSTDISLMLAGNAVKWRISALQTDIKKISKIFKNKNIIKCDNCTPAYISGAFLAGGIISDPEREYKIEFTGNSEETVFDLLLKLKNFNINGKIIDRKNQFVLYIKNSDEIEDLLTIMGASEASLDYMGVKVIKDVRNNTNRKNNFETANISRTSAAAIVQVEAINKLFKNKKIRNLPQPLKEAAIMRKKHKDMPLSELSIKMGLSRAGLHHRLRKIIEIAKENN